MKELLIARHAKSSWKDRTLDDPDRPLNARGKRDAPRLGRLLADEGIRPDLILCSTARRARQTVERAVDAADYDGPIEYERGLYHAGPAEIVEHLRRLPDHVDRVMVVGHNPAMEEFLAALLGESERLPTAALARLELAITAWAEMSLETPAELKRLWRPKDEA
jgi:phosphohistidine phosphatase